MNTPRRIPLSILTLLASACTALHSHAQTPADKATVSGTFLGDGKDGKIQHLVVQTREPFSDQAAIRLIFTEKNPAASKQPDFDAGFKRLGSALILSVFKDGGIFGCEVAHTAHPKSPFSAIGEIKMKDFKVTDTHVSGQVTTGGELDAFDQKWTVELTFSAPLPKGAFAAPAEPKKEEKPAPEAEPVAVGPKLSVADLPLPAAARDVEYKKVVEHITFRADASVSAVANDFAGKLKKQGWKEGPGGLMGKTNAILKRELNGADLTVMVQSAGKGCSVKVFTQGLDWSNPPDSGTANDAKPAKSTDADDIEAEAQRLIKDALKGIKIPGGIK